MKNDYTWKGRIRALVYEGTVCEDNLVDVIELDNTITTAGKSLLVSALAGVDSKIKYMAWGTGTTAPDANQTGLVSEQGRKQITSQQPNGNGSYLTKTYLSPNDANIHIYELGWFAGANATSTPGSGVMVARVLFDYNKTSTQAIIIERTDTLP